jgi:glycosyltransferase involved in cell wall biosynthesis
MSDMEFSGHDQPLVSILLPVRNGVATLRLALRSILAQNFREFEVLVLDDGSTDGSEKIAFSMEDERVRVIVDGLAKGLAFRLNQGIALAKGRYIARMDSDDVSFPERLQRQLDYLQSHPDIDLVGCRAIVFRDPDKVIGLLPFASNHQAICAKPWRGMPLPHPTWMGRIDWFRRYQYRFPEVLRAEDQDLLLRAFPESRYACLDDVLLGYRQGAFNLRKTLLARRTLLLAQTGIFVKRRQWKNAFMAFAATSLKVSLDVIASLPACSAAFFWRMSEPAPPSVVDELKHVLDKSE